MKKERPTLSPLFEEGRRNRPTTCIGLVVTNVNIDRMDIGQARQNLILKKQTGEEVEVYDRNDPERGTIIVSSEMIDFRSYVNPEGETFHIGWSEEVQTALGLPLQAWKNMEASFEVSRRNNQALMRRAYDLGKERDRLSEELKETKHWKKRYAMVLGLRWMYRLRYLFTGKFSWGKEDEERELKDGLGYYSSAK